MKAYDELKLEMEKNGFLVIENYFSAQKIISFKNSIELLSLSSDVDIFRDRSGKLRRMERFTFKNKILSELNEEIKKLLFPLTGKAQALFKDKVNFKPPNGEGFFPHYDGIFQFSKADGIKKNGWYEYSSDFNNVLITLDDFTIENGALEIASIRKGTFEKLLDDTKRDGSPELKDELIKELKFIPITCRSGSIVIFKHNCPHRSAPNHSTSDRGSLYLTYSNLEDGNFYEQYYVDKHSSINTHKALLGNEA